MPWIVALNWMVPTSAIDFPGAKFWVMVFSRCWVSMLMDTKMYSVAIFVTATGIRQLCA